eukprot:CAMPEP_0118633590 /NCGR_PEP_ID=MMETSP0785-20121206/1082_1 /TAXON_ID=91992 /ORGANISM="Bolidomonas pacifica, Strain CCMP 1866" /LENGTH=43 /DNA_ID= /DNA_START= /DNA_END= /DNA_ORIENTATION=
MTPSSIYQVCAKLLVTGALCTLSLTAFKYPSSASLYFLKSLKL